MRNVYIISSNKNEPTTPFSYYKNHVYKNFEAQITPKNKDIVILLVAISISFPASDDI